MIRLSASAARSGGASYGENGEFRGVPGWKLRERECRLMSRRYPTTLSDRTFRAVLADLAELDAEIEAARRRREEVVALPERQRRAS